MHEFCDEHEESLFTLKCCRNILLPGQLLLSFAIMSSFPAYDKHNFFATPERRGFFNAAKVEKLI